MAALIHRWFRGPFEGSLGTEPRRMEGVLATARAYLAAFSLIAIYLDPTEPSRYAGLAYGLLGGYVVYSVLLVLALRSVAQPPTFLPVAVQSVDIVWAAVISLFTEGPNSPFFLFFVFVLLAAAYRWGSQATLATAGLAVAVLVGEAVVVAGPGGPSRFSESGLELNRFLIRAFYLLIVGYLLGYLGDAEKRVEHEASVIARIIRNVRAEAGVRRTLNAVLGELLDAFAAARAVLVLRESHTGRLYLWEATRALGGPRSQAHLSELEAAREKTYLFDCGGDAILAGRARDGAPYALAVLDGRGERVVGASPLPSDVAASHAFDSFLAVSLELGDEWSGRLFLLDPLERNEESDLRFLQRLVRETAPAVENVYLLRRLRARAGAVERARVARELHDGVIQALIGLEMQVDVLRRQALEKSPQTAGALSHIQAHLHQEILTVRELMEQMKPMDVAPTQLVEHLAQMVDKFHRETGIAADFASGVQEVSLPPPVCREIARIVQEALVNVRRHAAAASVLVRLGREADRYLLVIDDNGRGFGFSGRLAQPELDAARKGPVVIKERVRAIGGELTIESSPNRGSRLEVRLPWRAHG